MVWMVRLDAARGLARALLIAAEATLAPPALYLALLGGGALVAQTRRAVRRPDAPRQPLADDALPRFAILTPAHDEAAGVGATLASLAALDYPPERRALVVVADNCTDATAALARAGGAEVYERFDPQRRSKGYALAWLLERLAAEGRVFDAYVIVDADSRLSPNFLRRMAAALAAGAQVAQAQYRVANPASAWTAGLRAVAFALFNHARPLGRSVFGWSAGLKGNGMVFSRAVIERFGWRSSALAEDADHHALLLAEGVRTVYVPDALVLSDMPVTLRQARSQQERWERGRLDVTRGHATRLVGVALGTPSLGSLALLDAAMEALLPPLSLLALGVAACLGLAAALRSGLGLWLALGLAGALALYVGAGVALAQLPPRAYLSLLRAPLYVGWKGGLYLRALAGRGGGAWVRTAR